jgi:hypothetical protein
VAGRPVVGGLGELEAEGVTREREQQPAVDPAPDPPALADHRVVGTGVTDPPQDGNRLVELADSAHARSSGW